VPLKTVLIVEDDEDDKLLFCEALLKADNTSLFMTAKNGALALEILQNNDIKLPDFIFLDLNMPVMNGWQCLALIRKIKSLNHIPVIIYSTSHELREFEKARHLGNVYFLIKPTKLPDIMYGIICALKNDWHAMKEMNKRAYS
jgi:CheY-like chemotaxis protein